MGKYKYDLNELYINTKELNLIQYRPDNVANNFSFVINKSHKFSDIEKCLFIMGLSNYNMEVVYAEKSFEEWESKLSEDMSYEAKEYHYYHDMKDLSEIYSEWEKLKIVQETQFNEIINNVDLADLCEFLESRQQYWKNAKNERQDIENKTRSVYQEKITEFALNIARAKIKI